MDLESRAAGQSSTNTAGSHRLRPRRRHDQDPKESKSGTIHESLGDPSNQIRLLLATHGPHDDVLAFEISTYSLAEMPAYHAISYTWGQDDTQRSVIINSTVFHVNQNCYYALWQACLHYSETPVWIDSLCIDQSNSAEKSAQVWIMPEIYRGAARVLACVGPHADNSMVFAPAIPELERLKKLENTPYEWTTYNDNDDVKEFANLARESLGVEALMRIFWAFRAFKRRLYWRRLWIQQELGLAAEVQILCGDDILFGGSAQLLYDLYFEINCQVSVSQDWVSAAEWSYVHNEDARMLEWPFDRLTQLRTDGGTELGRLLYFSKDLDCEDFHDRVYGVLGLAKPGVREHLLPNYDLTAIQLALQAARVTTFHRIHSILTSLRIDCTDVDLRPLIERRHSCEVVVDYIAPEKRGRCSCYFLREERERELTALGGIVPFSEQFNRFCSQHTIQTDDDGCLTTDVDRDVNRSGAAVDNDALDAHATLFNVKRIFVNGQRVGFICHAARDGDTLVSLRVTGRRTFLVLRHSSAELYDLVGRGFLTSSYYLKESGVSSGDPETSVRQKSVAVRVSISPEESVAFWATELEERECEEPKGTIDRISWLDVPMTTHPHGAVQITDPKAIKS